MPTVNLGTVNTEFDELRFNLLAEIIKKLLGENVYMKEKLREYKIPIWLKSESEINKIFDSGAFKPLIEGYMLLALDEMGFEVPKTFSFNRFLEKYNAEDARLRM